MIPATLSLLRELGALEAIDVQAARALAKLGGETRPEVLLALAVTSAKVREGHVCVDLATLGAAHRRREDDAVVLVAWPDIEAWGAALRASPLVSDGTRITPLVLDRGRLYLRRFWEHERRLADAIGERLTPSDDALDAALLRDGLDRLFGPDEGGALDPRRLAAIVALRRRFAVIAGGPGTGKTWTVVRLLALALEQAARASLPTPTVLLLAPTGKAAARLVESIRGEKAKLRIDDAIRDAIPEQASTIHRALRPIPGSTTRFRHDAERPLACDLVLVDEASMVDVALMARLVAAIPAHARLVLLGDPHQLASVEAGALLGDVCEGATPGIVPSRLAREASELLGRHVPGGLPGPPIADAVVVLTKSRRFRDASGIGALARAIREGRADDALALLGDHADLAHERPTESGEPSAGVMRAIVEHYRPYLATREPAARLAALGAFRVLAAHRHGPWGVTSLNAQIERALALSGLASPKADAYDGEPVIVLANDYGLSLFNGDVGVTCTVDGALRVAFPRADGGVRLIAPARLPPHETVLAMTIHKSQGSEHDEIVVVLPDASSPLLVRELLYTAVTRAKKRVVIVGSDAAVRAAIDRRVARASGLADRLWR